MPCSDRYYVSILCQQDIPKVEVSGGLPMSSQSLSATSLHPADPGHLAAQRSRVERILADGKIFPKDADELCVALIGDGQIILDAMDVIRSVMQEHLGDAPLAFE
jgi:hypothetical protein